MAYKFASFSFSKRISNETVKEMAHVPKQQVCTIPRGLQWGSDWGPVPMGPWPGSLRPREGWKGHLQTNSTKSLPSTSTAVCQCPEGGGKRACLSKKIVPFEDSFEGIESLVLTETCCFTLNDNGTEAMGNWRILKKFARKRKKEGCWG